MFLQLIFHWFSIFSYYILEGNWFMTLRWTLPLLFPFDFKHPNNSYTLVLGQILISDLWGTATLSFSCSLFSIRVVRSWSLRLRWDFLSSSAWCFQFCFIHSGHPVNTNWNDFKQKPELGGSEPAPNETPCSSLPSSYRLNGVAWGTTTFPTASCGPIQSNISLLHYTKKERARWHGIYMRYKLH